jgi:hypothetical protein
MSKSCIPFEIGEWIRDCPRSLPREERIAMGTCASPPADHLAGVLFSNLQNVKADHFATMVPRMLLEMRQAPSGPVFGLFCAVSAVVMGIQTYKGWKGGWAYNGRTSRAYKKDSPKQFYLWFTLQVLMVIALAIFAIDAVTGFLPH